MLRSALRRSFAAQLLPRTNVVSPIARVAVAQVQAQAQVGSRSLNLHGLGVQGVRFVSTPADEKTLAEAKEKQEKLQADWDAPVMSYEDVKARSRQPSPNAYLIDVREPDEVIQGSIPSSVNLPLSGLAADLHLNPVAFKEKHGWEKPQKGQEVVFYCRSGKRSASACDVAKRNGYTNIHNYSGSWLDWTAKQQGTK